MTHAQRAFIQRAEAAADSHITTPQFCVSSFAGIMGLSRSQLHRKLVSLTGLSASAFLRSRRVKRAVYLMEQGVQPLSEVARQAGFNHTSYFMRTFKGELGVTPAAFQKELCNE